MLSHTDWLRPVEGWWWPPISASSLVNCSLRLAWERKGARSRGLAGGRDVSPGTASHWVITSTAVPWTASSGTSWSTMPTLRASGAGYRSPSCKERSVARWPMVLIIVSLNLATERPSQVTGAQLGHEPLCTWLGTQKPQETPPRPPAAGKLTRKAQQYPASSRSAQWRTWDCQP